MPVGKNHAGVGLRNENSQLELNVTRRVKKDMLSANTVLRYRPVKFVKYKEKNRNKYAS